MTRSMAPVSSLTKRTFSQLLPPSTVLKMPRSGFDRPLVAGGRDIDDVRILRVDDDPGDRVGARESHVLPRSCRRPWTCRRRSRPASCGKCWPRLCRPRPSAGWTGRWRYRRWPSTARSQRSGSRSSPRFRFSTLRRMPWPHRSCSSCLWAHDGDVRAPAADVGRSQELPLQVLEREPGHGLRGGEALEPQL